MAAEGASSHACTEDVRVPDLRSPNVVRPGLAVSRAAAIRAADGFREANGATPSGIAASAIVHWALQAAGSCRLPTLPELAAAGSLPHLRGLARPSIRRRVRLSAELILLFAGAPLAMSYAVNAAHVPLLLLLLPVLIGFAAYLRADCSFALARELSGSAGARDLMQIVALFFFAGGVLTLWMWLARPAQFLSIPLDQVEIWVALMLLYPLISVLPQELIFRSFFFHRYGPLFRGQPWLAIGVNGALFGFAHLIYGNYEAVVLSAALGLLLAYRYARTRSLWAVCVEHTLYGELAFAIGLGHYFFIGLPAL
jgi:uncharacterized protein